MTEKTNKQTSAGTNKGNEKHIEPLKSNKKKVERSTIAIFEFMADNIDGLINHCNK